MLSSYRYLEFLLGHGMEDRKKNPRSIHSISAKEKLATRAVIVFEFQISCSSSYGSITSFLRIFCPNAHTSRGPTTVSQAASPRVAPHELHTQPHGGTEAHAHLRPVAPATSRMPTTSRDTRHGPRRLPPSLRVRCEDCSLDARLDELEPHRRSAKLIDRTL